MTKMTSDRYQADHHRMKAFIAARIPEEGCQVVLADGPEGGEAWADLTPTWDDEHGWDLHLETNEPEWVGLREVHQHFRRQEMTWGKWSREIAGFFRIPVEEFNRQGDGGSSEMSARLDRIEGKLDAVLKKQPEGSIVAEYVSIKQAVKITELSASHIRRAVRSGALPASNAGTRWHPVWRIGRKDLDGWMEKKKGGQGVPSKSRLKELVNRHLPDLR